MHTLLLALCGAAVAVLYFIIHEAAESGTFGNHCTGNCRQGRDCDCGREEY